MLNWADFSVLLMVLIGPISAFAAAKQLKAETSSAIFFSFIGVAVGLGVGWLVNKLAYATLESKKLPEGWKALFYLLIPIFGIFAVVLITVLWAKAYYWRTPLSN